MHFRRQIDVESDFFSKNIENDKKYFERDFFFLVLHIRFCICFKGKSLSLFSEKSWKICGVNRSWKKFLGQTKIIYQNFNKLSEKQILKFSNISAICLTKKKSIDVLREKKNP